MAPDCEGPRRALSESAPSQNHWNLFGKFCNQNWHHTHTLISQDVRLLCVYTVFVHPTRQGGGLTAGIRGTQNWGAEKNNFLRQFSNFSPPSDLQGPGDRLGGKWRVSLKQNNQNEREALKFLISTTSQFTPGLRSNGSIRIQKKTGGGKIPDRTDIDGNVGGHLRTLLNQTYSVAKASAASG